MAIINYTGNAPTVAQVDTLTPGGTIATGNVFTVTINGKSVSYIATGTTVASVCTGLHALLAASTFPEFAEIVWADGVTAITATARVAGRPHVIAVFEAQGTGGTDLQTFGVATTTTNSSPSDIAVATNYSSGSLPANSDTLNIDGLAVDLLWNLDALDDKTGLIINVTNYRGAMCLPERNAAGYDEYRPTHFTAGIAICNYAGSGRAKFDVMDPGAPCAFTVAAPSSQSAETGVEAILIRGGTATNHIDLLVNKGSVGVAVLPTDVAHIGAFTSGYQTSQANDAKVRFGAGVVFNDDEYTVLGGQVETNSDVGTIELYPNSTVTLAGGEVDTLITNRGGTLVVEAATTPVVKYIGYAGSKLDLRKRLDPIVFTDLEFYSGAEIVGGEGLFAHTNPIKLLGCGLADVKLPKDKNITVALAAI